MKTPIPIKPCPNCGGKKIWHVHSFPADVWNMVCSECYYEGKVHKLHRKAIRRWNQRANELKESEERRLNILQVDKLEDTERDNVGFGSTGR